MTRSSSDRLRVRREQRFADDGFRAVLVPGLRSSADAERLADEIAFASARLQVLAAEPPGLYAQAASEADIEQATWLCFLSAYLSPLQAHGEEGIAPQGGAPGGDDPFAAIAAVVTDWRTGELPSLDGVALGPRTSHDPVRGTETLEAYRKWAARAGSQQLGFTGDESWTPERRFERVYERLTFPGFVRSGRFDLLVTLGRLGLYELRADSLHLVGEDATTVAAKRAFAIGDRDKQARPARTRAEEAEVALESLDLALENWAGSGERVTLGVPEDATDEDARARVLAALGL